MNGNNEFKTFGVILIKYTSNMKGHERELRDFLISLPQKQNDVKRGKKGCSTCAERNNGNRYCGDLKFISASTLVGFFDFGLTLIAKNIETIEDFIIDCLRNGEKKGLISETQTIAGTIFSNWTSE